MKNLRGFNLENIEDEDIRKALESIEKTFRDDINLDNINRYKNNESNLKQYTLNITSAAAGFAVSRAIGIPYKTIDGTWRFRFNIAFTTNAAALVLITIADIIFKNDPASLKQAVAVLLDLDASSSYALGGTGGIYAYSGAGNSSNWYLSADLELDGRPDLIDT